MVSRIVLTDILSLVDYLLEQRANNDIPVTIVVTNEEAFEQTITTAPIQVGHFNLLRKVNVVYAESKQEFFGLFDLADNASDCIFGVFGAFAGWEDLTVEMTENLLHLVSEAEYYDGKKVYFSEISSEAWRMPLSLKHHQEEVVLEAVLQRWNVIYKS